MGGRGLLAACAIAILALAGASVVAVTAWPRDDGPGRLAITFLPGGASLWDGPCGERGIVEIGRAPSADLGRHLDGGGDDIAWVYSSGDGEEFAGAVPAGDAAVAYEPVDGGVHPESPYAAWARDADVPRESVAAGDEFTLCDGAGRVGFELADDGCLKVTHRRFTVATCGVPADLGPIDVAVVHGDGEWVAPARPAVVVDGSADRQLAEGRDTFGAVYPLGAVTEQGAGGEVTITTTGRQRFTVTGAGGLARAHPIGRGGGGRAPRAGFDGDPATTERIGWGVAEEAGIRVSEARFPDRTAAHVVLAQTGEAAGSLIAAPLSREGPLLHVDPGRLPPAVRREIRRVLPEGGTVYLVGAASGDAVAAPLREDGFTVVEFGGENRVEVSVAVADDLLRRYPGDEVALVPGWPTANEPTGGSADVVAAVAWATAFDVPVVLTRGDHVPAAVSDALARWQPERVWLFGNERRLAPEIADTVPGPVRVAGAGPAPTAVSVVEDLWGGAGDRYVVVNAYSEEGWLAALAAAGLSADFEAPFLLTDADRVPAATRQELASCGRVPEILLLGGRVHLSEDAERELEAARREAC